MYIDRYIRTLLCADTSACLAPRASHVSFRYCDDAEAGVTLILSKDQPMTGEQEEKKKGYPDKRINGYTEE